LDCGVPEKASKALIPGAGLLLPVSVPAAAWSDWRGFGFFVSSSPAIVFALLRVARYLERFVGVRIYPVLANLGHLEGNNIEDKAYLPE
jgi:hypothetical protein